MAGFSKFQFSAVFWQINAPGPLLKVYHMACAGLYFVIDCVNACTEGCVTLRIRFVCVHRDCVCMNAVKYTEKRTLSVPIPNAGNESHFAMATSTGS